MAIPRWQLFIGEAGSAPADRRPDRADRGRMGNSTPGGCAVCPDFRQIPGLHPKGGFFPRPSWKT